MPLVVLPALIADIDPVYDVYFAAFQGQPILDFLFPGGVDRKAHKEGTIKWFNTDDVSHTVKCVDSDTGDVVGMCTWDIFWRPGEENGWKKPEGIPWLEGRDKERCEKVVKPMWDMREKLFGKRRYIYLPSMAVHPDHQRRGAGRLLVQWGIDVAEKFGLPIYTESTKTGFPLYNHMGFETLTHEKVIHKAEETGEAEDVDVPLMVRMPSAAKGMSFKEWADKGYPEDYR